MAQFTSSDYTAAGLHTLSRQCISHYLYKIFPSDTATSIGGLFGLDVHRLIVAFKILEQAIGTMIILTEQAAYPLLLQTSHEIDKLMATQIPLEKRQLNILKPIVAIYAVYSPLAGISFTNYIDSFKAQIDAHQTVLDHFNSLWTWVETEVTGVIDGDTIIVSEYPNMSVRFEGIDAPELDTPEGEEAKAYVEERLLGQKIRLRARSKLDIYGRVIAKIYFPDDKNFAWEMVAAGHAEMVFWTYWF